MAHKLFRSLFVLVFVIGLLAIQAPQPARAAGPWYVSTMGDDNNDCLSPTTPCATINGAIGKASGGDTIYVAEGIYTGMGDEVALIDIDVTLSGGWDGSFTTQSGMSTIEGDGARRGITVNSGVTAVIERLLVQNGLDGFNSPIGEGGGIRNEGMLTMNNSTISNNEATGNTSRGGGIYNESNSTLTISDSILIGNIADEGQGGGIYNNGGIVTLNNSTVSDNMSDRDGGGVLNSFGTVTINNSTVSDNTTTYSGGGIFNIGNLTINDSILSGNKVSPPDGSGGGINNKGMLILNNSTVSENTAGWHSGGIYNSGMATITQSTISNNMAITAGGVWNDGGFGGNVGILNINNATISNNISTANGGGIVNSSSGVSNINNSTVTGNNSAGDGGGVFNVATMYVQNTIVAKNTVAGIGPDCSGSMTSMGYNVISNTSGCTFASNTGDQINVDSLIGILQDNGGSTFTHALLPGSPAIDAGNPAGCTDQDGNLLTTDQRGVARPQGAVCDIGAFELEVSNPVKEVTIDIKPGSNSNPINRKSLGKIPVAILSTPDFDAPSEIDKASLTFGSAGDEASLAFCNKGAEDVNNDGLLDQVCHFYTWKTGFQAGDIEGLFKGQTIDGTSIEGRDSVRIVH